MLPLLGKVLYNFYSSYFRIEGRVQRFTFVRDEAFDLLEQREHALMALAGDDKVNKDICRWSTFHLSVMTNHNSIVTQSKLEALTHNLPKVSLCRVNALVQVVLSFSFALHW